MQQFLNRPIPINLIPSVAADAPALCRGEFPLEYSEDFKKRAKDWIVDFFFFFVWDENFVREWAGTAMFTETMGDRLIKAVFEIGKDRGNMYAVSRFFSGLMNVMYESGRRLYGETHFYEEFFRAILYNFEDEFKDDPNVIDDIIGDIMPPSITINKKIGFRLGFLIELFNEYREAHGCTLQDWIILWAMFNNQRLLLGEGVRAIDVIEKMLEIPDVTIKDSVDELCEFIQLLDAERVPFDEEQYELQQRVRIDMNRLSRPIGKVESLIPRIRYGIRR